MRRFFENLEQAAIEIILGKRHGKSATLLRAVLLQCSHLYRLIITGRLFLYRKAFFKQRRVGCPVISIGNLTVGGTGKTPIVEKLARELTLKKRRVAILSRGYKSVPKSFTQRMSERLFQKKGLFAPRVVSEGGPLLLSSRHAGDEPFMLAKNLKEVAVLVDRDRTKSALYAIKKLGSDILLLDDGLQYIKLYHRFDIILVDYQSPFGNEFLLPRGTLREPPANLRRATHIIITKSPGGDISPLYERLRNYNKTADIIECTHAPIGLTHLTTGEQIPLSRLKGVDVAALSGIASPKSFHRGLEQLGAHVAFCQSYTDHHRYSRREVERFIKRSLRRALPMIITTEKDAVRIPRLNQLEVPIYYLRIEIQILKGQDTWDKMVSTFANPANLSSTLPLTR